MERRDWLRTVGAAVPALAALSPDDLLAVGRAAHARAGGSGALTAQQQATVAAIAERIIPATDTPGAREAGVAEFVDVIVGQWYAAGDRERFQRGLAELDDHCRAFLGKTFGDAAPGEQDAVLTGLEAEARALRAANPSAPRHFFDQIKGLTLHGYYTSEIGMRQELRFHVIPGRYDGCIDPAAIPAPPGGGGL